MEDLLRLEGCGEPVKVSTVLPDLAQGLRLSLPDPGRDPFQQQCSEPVLEGRGEPKS